MSEQLATIKRIDTVTTINSQADIITVDDWTVVVSADTFAAGQLVLYIQPNSWVPNSLLPVQQPSVHNNILGHAVETQLLHGHVSSGIVLPLQQQVTVAGQIHYISVAGTKHAVYENDDVTTLLEVTPYDNISVSLNTGPVYPYFPSFIHPTSIEQVQNCQEQYAVWKDNAEYKWQVTEAVRGAAVTVFINNDIPGVCSATENFISNSDNSYWAIAERYKLHQAIASTDKNLALQGVIVGPGVDDNRYQLKNLEFMLFRVYNIHTMEVYSPHQCYEFASSMNIPHVPLVVDSLVIEESVRDMIRFSDDKSNICTTVNRAGLVFKCYTDSSAVFRITSLRYLLNS